MEKRKAVRDSEDGRSWKKTHRPDDRSSKSKILVGGVSVAKEFDDDDDEGTVFLEDELIYDNETVQPFDIPTGTIDKLVPPWDIPTGTIDKLVPPWDIPTGTIDKLVPPFDIPTGTIDKLVPPWDTPTGIPVQHGKILSPIGAPHIKGSTAEGFICSGDFTWTRERKVPPLPNKVK